MTDKEHIQQLRIPTVEDPLRILVSSCLIGTLCGVDGESYGEYPSVLKLLHCDNVRLLPFCPENYSFGTPREMCDIHGGTGQDVLDGRAHVLTESGVDWTDGILRAAERMVSVAKLNDVELAIMMDISAACGSQVIYDGNRKVDDPVYQIGEGVCTALLRREGFKVISQRDYHALELLYSKIDPSHTIDPEKKDHDRQPWYLEYFGK